MPTRRRPPTPPFPHDVDPLVQPLLTILNRIGLRTIGSCQGHLPADRTTPGISAFPCIIIEPPRKQGPIFLLADVISPRGWCWYRQHAGTELLRHTWQLTAHSAPPYLNPGYGSLVLEPTIFRIGDSDTLPTYPDLLRDLQADLETIATGLTLYLHEHGVPPEPKRAARQ